MNECNTTTVLQVLEARCNNVVMSQSVNEPSLHSAYIILYLEPTRYTLIFVDNLDYNRIRMKDQDYDH